MRVNAKVVSVAIPTILTLCVELFLLAIQGASVLFWQECVITLVILAASIAYNLKATQTSPVFGLSLGAIASITLLLQLFINIVIVIACPQDRLNGIALILGLILLALLAILAIASLFSANHAQSVEEENAARTDKMQEIRIRLNALAASAPPEQRALVQKVADAARYASPVSDEHTAQVDGELVEAVRSIENAMEKEDSQKLEVRIQTVIALLDKHNALSQGR